MNIFILSKDFNKAAKYLADQHIVKMSTESAQMISMAFFKPPVRVNYFNKEKQKNTWKNKWYFCLGKKPSFIMLPTVQHYYHPCTVWTRESLDNLIWHCDYSISMYNEYKRRFPNGQGHQRAIQIFNYAKEHGHLLTFPKTGMTEFAQAMPDDVKHRDTVTAYRNYYRYYKSRFARYRYSTPPAWYVNTPGVLLL